MIRPSIAVFALLVAVPAAAQFTDRSPPTGGRSPTTVRSPYRLPDAGVWRDTRDVRRQIERGRDAGTLTRREARRFGRENSQIGVLADRYAEDGELSDAERRELGMRSAVLRDQVNAQRLKGAGPK